MLDRVDRILVASHNAEAAANRWVELVDAQIDRRDEVPALNSQRVVVRLADAELEVHQPLGAGPIADHLANSSGPFAGGMTSQDMDGLTEHLAYQKVKGLDIGNGQQYFDSAALGIPGLRLVLSPPQDLAAVGLLDTLYECTHLTEDSVTSKADIAKLFNLDPDQFVSINSETYGYDGTLTLYDNRRLHRIETINPYAQEKSMGRFMGRFGPSMYMCYAETADLKPLQQRLKDLAPKDWTGEVSNQDVLFLHPRATGTTMMGVSRTSHAWTWSGYPDRVKPQGG